jgi:outer membrane protein assembly factor BamB
MRVLGQECLKTRMDSACLIVDFEPFLAPFTKESTMRKPAQLVIRFCCGAVLIAALGACGSLNPFADPPRNAPVELKDFTASAKLSTAWQTSVGSGAIGAPALVASGGQPRLIATASETIGVLDALNGAILKRIETTGPLSTPAGSDGELIVAATREGEVFAWNMDGAQQWRATLNAEVLARPAITDGTAAVLTTDGRLVGYDTSNGKRRWVVQRPAPALALRIASPIVPVRGGFLVGMSGGRVMAVAARDGQVRWETSLAQPKGSNEVERIADIAPAVGALSGDLCLAAYQGRVGCVAARDGKVAWARDFSSAVGVGTANNQVLATDERSIVHGLGGSAGATLWTNEDLRDRKVTAPVASGTHAVVGDYKGYVHLLNLRDGKLAARASTDGSAIQGAPVLIEVQSRRLVAVQTARGSVFAFVQE